MKHVNFKYMHAYGFPNLRRHIRLFVISALANHWRLTKYEGSLAKRVFVADLTADGKIKIMKFFTPCGAQWLSSRPTACSKLLQSHGSWTCRFFNSFACNNWNYEMRVSLLIQFENFRKKIQYCPAIELLGG